MTKVTKVEDINSEFTLRTSRGLQRKTDSIMEVDLWDSTMKQVLLQFTDLTISGVDERSRIYLSVDPEKHSKIIDCIHGIEEKALATFKQIMIQKKIKGDFTFSSIISTSPDGIMMCFDTEYPDYKTTLIGVTPHAKGRIDVNDLQLSPEEVSGGVGQVCSVIVELMGIVLDISQSPAHISLEYRLRIAKARKVIHPIRHVISDPDILQDNDRVTNESMNGHSVTEELEHMVDDKVIQDVDALVGAIGGTCAKEPEDADAQEESENYVDILNDNDYVEDDEGDVEEGDDEEPDTDPQIESSDSGEDIANNLAKIINDSKKVTGSDIEDLDELDQRGKDINSGTIVSAEVPSEDDEEDEEEDDDEEDDEDEEDEEDDDDDVVDDDTSDDESN
jgi:hypothetical protein